jgi:hypothetical protein
LRAARRSARASARARRARSPTCIPPSPRCRATGASSRSAPTPRTSSPPTRGRRRPRCSPRDRCTAETEIVSKTNGDQSGTAFSPDVSDDGCLVVYRSAAVSPARCPGRPRCSAIVAPGARRGSTSRTR